MIQLLEVGSSVSILNTDTSVLRAESGLSVLDRCGCTPFKQPLVLDNGVELSAIEDELVLRHPYDLPLHVLCTGEFSMQSQKIKLTTYRLMWQMGKHTTPRGTNTLYDGDTFDVKINGDYLAIFKQTAYGLRVSSFFGVQMELE